MKKAPAPKTIYQITLWLADTGNGVCTHCVWVDVFMRLCVCVYVCFRLSVAGVTHSSQGT